MLCFFLVITNKYSTITHLTISQLNCNSLTHRSQLYKQEKMYFLYNNNKLRRNIN